MTLPVFLIAGIANFEVPGKNDNGRRVIDFCSEKSYL